MHIRQVEPRDRAEWLRLLMALYERSRESDHLPSIDAFLTGADSAELLPSAVFVGERPDGGLAGVLELSVRDYAEGCAGATPYVESWFVDPDVRRAGVGRALLAGAERWAHEHGYQELASDALIDNVVSQRVHRAAGFDEVERSVHFRKKVVAPLDAIGKPARRIVGFEQDDQGDWVARLECGHGQHVRHNPPWINRPWVITAEGRAQAIGRTLECAKCVAEAR